MRKIFTLLSLLLFAVFFASAQSTDCNAEFGIVYQNPNTVQFNPVPAGTLAGLQHNWAFGDGGTSNTVAPAHTYLSSGAFTARHIVVRFNPNGVEICRDTFYRVVQIGTTTNCTLVANFTWAATSAPNTFHFENTSAPLNNTDSIRWTFGDGTESHEMNPTHVYAQPGTYTVCLRVQKREPNGTLTSCIREICHTVVVISPTACTLVAGFTWSATSTPNTFHFENTSAPLSNTDSVRWTFGDGTSSGVIHPTHTYLQPGSYNVCLRIQKVNPNGTLSNCVREICHIVYVQGTTVNCLQQSQFNFSSTAANALLFNFTPAHINNDWQYTWTFGDGTGSHDISPLHQYQLPGNYTACLTVFRNPGCASTTCRQVTAIPPTTTNCTLVVYPNPVTTSVNFNVILAQPQMIDAFIFNSMNVLVREKHQQGVNGTNMISIEANNLPAGTYTLKVMYGGQVCYTQFVKL